MTTAASGERPTEIEIKLEIEPGGGAMLCQSRVLAGLALNDREQFTTYFDTPEQDLRVAGISLRVRRTGDRHVQTIKTISAPGVGIFARPEWEQDVAGSSPDLGDSSPIREMVNAEVLSRLRPAFTVAVRRRSWRVESGDAVMEVVLDEGTVRASGCEAPIAEIEAELQHGEPEALFSLARTLGGELPLRLGVLTKAERGYRLAEGRLYTPVKAERVPIGAESDVAEAFATIAASCLRQFRLNEELLRSNPEPDALHQARVALRRLRSALSIFKPVVADDRSRHLAAELRHLARSLGAARDLDVLIETLGPHVNESVRAAHAEAYAAALATLDAQRTRDLMIDLMAWIASGDWRVRPADPAATNQTAKRFASATLGKLRRRLKKRGSHLAELDDEERHQVRILTKKLRYATDFFGPLFTGKKARQRYKVFSKKLAALQEHLGTLNDLATAPPLLARHGIDPAALPAYKRRALLTKASDAHAALVEAKRFW
ncbi:CHAD domain-containing protein [Sphingomonas mucosissima]|uniref:Inorganic triphosphatase n=1 Tax=Sphingomonas mucosissima TaxID=370959 RepID=A0A245ZIM1_9SPHN|nr:CHAD domain-containing protein [Sphingomonas mucosissima]OWK29589.1 inorganic triphosphatase [Sphingomonas mucosissima]